MKRRGLAVLLAGLLSLSSLGLAEAMIIPSLLPPFGHHQLALVGYKQGANKPVWFLAPFPWSCGALVLHGSFIVCYDVPFLYYHARTR